MYEVSVVVASRLLMLTYIVDPKPPDKLYGSPSDLTIDPSLMAIWLLELPS